MLAAFSGWAIRLVQRECWRLRRVTRRYDAYDEAQLELELVVRDAARLRVELAAALKSLPPQDREVMLLRDLEAPTIAAITTRTGLADANVKSRLHRARVLARESLLAP